MKYLIDKNYRLGYIRPSYLSVLSTLQHNTINCLFMGV